MSTRAPTLPLSCITEREDNLRGNILALYHKRLEALRNTPKQTWLCENGLMGDCWRCCIAAWLGMPAAEVPHFLVAYPKDNLDAATGRWLSARGYRLITAPVGQLQPAAQHSEGAIGLMTISCGPTIRSKGPRDQHAVITVGGDLVYDPHPSNAGLLATVYEYVLVPIL